MLVETDHPVAGRHRMVGSPIKMGGVPEPEGRNSPELGQHSSEVLSELLGYDAARLAALREEGVVG